MDTCLNWKSEELQKLAEQVGVQATPAFADKVGTLMEKLGITAPVNYPTILEVDEILSGLVDKTRVAANYNYEENIIRIDKILLKQKFEEKAWTKPRKLIQMLHGKQVESYAQALPEDAFKTYEEFEKFVIEHEYQHSLYTRKDFKEEYPDGTEGEYETIINNNATKALSNRPFTSLPSPQLQSMKTVYGSNVSIRDASDPYKKTDPSENPDVAFVFTENAQAYAATTPSMRGGDKLLSTASPETVKINVSDMAGTKTPNTAGIRSIDGKTKQPNVFGIVVKKYQQLNGINSKFVAKEGQFNDTNSDFMLFQAFNRDFFEKLQLSKKKEIIMPGSIALGRSALPLRFAEWLQKEINNRLGVNYSIAKTETAGYDGYGLKFNSEINIESQLPTPQQVKDYLKKNKPVEKKVEKDTRKRLAHAEVLLPAWMSSFFGPEFRTADNTVDFDKLNEMIGERGFKGLGYRIPTEDKYSLLPIRVIGFLPESGGGAIMLPAEITTIAGSDFDIDKMYTIFKNIRQIVNKDGQTEFKVIEYLDNSNSTVEERWKIVANTKPEVRAVKDKYSEAIEAAQKTLDRSIKIQRDKLDKLKTEKKSQEEQINNLTEDIEVTKLERELAFDMVEMLTTELNHRKDELASPEELQSLYDNIDANKAIIKNSNEALEKLYQQRSELSKTKFRKEDVEARYNKKNEAFQKYLKAKNDVIADMWKEVDTVFPLKDFKELPMAEQNIRQARDNHKLDLMLTVMSSEHTTLSVLSPGGYEYLKNTVMANIIKNKGGVKKAKNIFSLNDIDMMTLQNLAGKALVGIAANHNKHHTLRQWSNLSLVNPVLFDNQSFVSLHNKEAYSVDGSQRTITRNLAEILAAVVDNAKDPVANVLNYNEHTADLISMLIGTGADINTVFAFVNQPIFTQAMELLNTRKEKNLVDAIKKAAEMNELTLPVDNKKIKARNLNLGDLNRNMTKFNKGFQYEVAISALAYIKQSKDLGLLIRASKADTAGIGQRVEDGVYLETQINDAKEIKTINGVEEFLNESSRFTKMFTEYGVSKPLSILEEMYPYSKKEFKELKSDLEAFIPGELSADDRQEINRAYIQYKMHEFGYYKYANREAIVKSTPALLEQIKDKYPELKDSNYLIRYLQVNYGNKDAGIPIIEFSNSLTSSEEQVNKSKQSWKEMFNESARQNLIDFINTKVPEKQRNELATKTDGFTNLIKVWNDRNLFQSDEAKKVLKDFVLNHLANSLIRYSFFTTGHEFTPTSIKQLIPVDVYMNLKDDSGMTIGRYENMLLQQAENETDYRNFIDQFIRHRYAIPKYVARVADDKSNISSYDSKTDTIIVGKDKLKATNPLIAEEVVFGTLTEIVPTSEYIVIKNNNDYKLYKAASPMSEDGYSIEEQVVFERIEALGISNRVEYSSDPIERSLYKKNNVVPPSSQPHAAPVAPTPVPPVKDPEGLVTDKEADDRLKICKL